jgi:hypothetical protein
VLVVAFVRSTTTTLLAACCCCTRCGPAAVGRPLLLLLKARTLLQCWTVVCLCNLLVACILRVLLRISTDFCVGAGSVFDTCSVMCCAVQLLVVPVKRHKNLPCETAPNRLSRTQAQKSWKAVPTYPIVTRKQPRRSPWPENSEKCNIIQIISMARREGGLGSLSLLRWTTATRRG